MQTKSIDMTPKVTYSIAAAVFVVFFLVALLTLGKYTCDETIFHFPNVINFYENGIDAMFNAHYSAANTPLPYMIVALAAKIFSPTLLLARIITCIISFCSFLAAMKLLELSDAPLHLSFVFLFFPYFFVNAFVFYVVNFGLFFALLALIVVHKTLGRNSYGSDFLAGILFSLAVLCQQFYLVVPAAVIIARVLYALRGRMHVSSPEFKTMALSGIVMLVPMILPLLLFLRWGGLTHPDFRFHSIGFYPPTIVGILFVTGFYFAPFLLQSYKALTRGKVILALTLSVVLVFFFKPTFSNHQGPGLFTGITHHLIIAAGKIHPAFSVVMMIGLTCSGILVLVELITQLSSEWDSGIFIACALFAIAYTFNTLIGEKHLLPYTVFLFFLILPRIRKPVALFYPVAMAVLGMSYFVYWFFIKYQAM
ncbi:MAG: hypothetical protein WB699_12655 [Bacteroidota bacterium]